MDPVKDGPGTSDAMCSSRRSDQEDSVSIADTGTVVSQSPSLRSYVSSGVTSLHSLHSSKYHLSSKRTTVGDDLLSDVPAISESIADMDDLKELRMDCSQTLIDNRQHPLAPFSAASSCCSWGDSSMSPVFADLGASSDVPSIRDDASIASGPSEICMSFRGTRNSGSRCGSRCGSKEDISRVRTKIAPKSGALGQLWSWPSRPVPAEGECTSVVLEGEATHQEDRVRLGFTGPKRKDLLSTPSHDSRAGRATQSALPDKGASPCNVERC